MAQHHIRQIRGEVFSAKRFFELCGDGETNPNARVPFHVDLLTKGVHTSPATCGSHVWIDGVYADSVAQEQFFASLLRGETPTPILDRTTRTVQSRMVYTAPEVLGGTSQTILSACGLVQTACEAALRARHAVCPQCGALIPRYASPLELLRAVTEEWHNTYISFFAESPNPDFIGWAASLGLPLQTHPTGISSACLDQLVCQPDTVATLGNLLHSTWRVPNIRFACVSAAGESRRYAPAGWCNVCNLGALHPSRMQLASILTRGLEGAHSRVPEALLTLDRHQTVEQLLCSPIHTLEFSPESPFITAQKLLSSLSLGTCSFGSRTDSFGARDLAKISLISSLLRAHSSRDHLIIDLPRGIFGDESTGAIQRLLDDAGRTHGISVVGDPFDSGTTPKVENGEQKEVGRVLLHFSLEARNAEHGSDHTLHIGELLRFRQSTTHSHDLFHDLTKRIAAKLQHGEIAAQLRPIPVFENNRSSSKVLGEELGLLEPLAHLYAASLDARMHGLTAKDFILFGTRSPRYACAHCRGLGVLLSPYQQLPRPLAAPCPVCRGLRCKSPVGSALFRGISFSTTLNQSIERSSETLTALSKAKQTLHHVQALGLQHLPLGMPLALLSSSELRRLRIVQAVTQSRASRPSIVLLEEPWVGLLDHYRDAIVQIRDAALTEKAIAWIETRREE